MKPPVVVVYKTIYRKKEKLNLKVFHDILVDDVIDMGKRKPLIPNDAEILEIGVGSSFEERYKKKYKIEESLVEESFKDKAIKELQKVVNEQRGQ